MASRSLLPKRAPTTQLPQRLHAPSISISRSFSSSAAHSSFSNTSHYSSDNPLPRVAGPPSESARMARWQQTPPRLSLPFKLRRAQSVPEMKCNNDPKKLDNMYLDLFSSVTGRDGKTIGQLTEETKWLAVTHKSFDQGRRGFNERLSLLGRRLVEAETSMALAAQSSSKSFAGEVDEYGREPFDHPQLRGIETLAEKPLGEVLTKWNLFGLASKYGIPAILRWKPKNPYDPQRSGLDGVATQCLYAIVGAVALEKGGYEAKMLVREKILKPLKVVQI